VRQARSRLPRSCALAKALQDEWRVRRGLVALVLIGMVSGVAHAQRLGRCTRGRLVDSRRLPERGKGWRIPETWLKRGLSFGTPALVDLIAKVARRVRAERPGSTLYVADLSFPRGGRSAWHRTHREGRDVDLLFYAIDRRGRQAPPPEQMIPFDADGLSPDGELAFDLERNWSLIRALVQDKRVDKIFVAPWVETLILGWAQAHERSDTLVARAAQVLSTPGAVEPHDDHFHVRVACVSPTVIRNKARSGAARAGGSSRRESERPAR
jgi:penicillin-insensitive murein endopeptidase